MSDEEPKPSEQPSLIWNMPYPRHAHFTGRAEQLAELRKSLTQKAAADHVQVICAPGGTGKTQLVVEYAYRQRWEYAVIWWLRANDPMTLALAYAEMAGQLGVHFGSEVSLEDIRHILRNMLAGRKDWLLIFDNAIDATTIEPYIPSPCNGHVLVTTRNSRWQGKSTVQILSPMRRSESIALLRARTNRIDPNEIASKLAQALGDLPLALEQAGSVIDLGRISFADYLKRFEAHWSELLQQGLRQYADFPEPVAMTCELSIRELETQAPGCAELLTYCSFFAIEEIKTEFLTGSLEYAPAALKPVLASQLTLSSSLAWLAQFSLIESSTKGVSMHRLVAQLARNRLGSETRRFWAEQAVNRIASVFDFQSQDPATWQRCAELLPHLLAVAEHGIDQEVWLGAVASLLDAAGRYLMRMGQFTQAKELLTRAMGVYERLWGESNPKVSAAANNLGRVLTRLGEHGQAQIQFQRALAIDQAMYGDNDPRVATVVNNYAMALHAAGDAQAARSQFEWVLRVYEFHYGSENPKTASVLNNLGFVTNEIGDAAMAREYLKRALGIAQGVYGDSHPMTGSILCNLGNLLRNAGELEAAREMLEKALSIDEAAYGRTHPDVARDCEAIALLLERIGDLPAAREHMERALSIDESVYGADHPLLLRRLLPLQRIVRRSDDEPAAENIGRRIAEIHRNRAEQLHSANLPQFIPAFSDADQTDPAGT